MSDIDRRTFLVTGAAGVLGLVAQEAPAPGPSLRVPLVHAGLPDDFSDGVDFGFDEASRSARLFDRAVTLDRHVAKAPANSVIAISTLQDYDALTACARSTRAAVINVACSSERLRHTPCPENVFHVMPSQSALQQVLAGVRPAPPGPARVELWHHALERFGAAQLNERFMRALRRPMTSRDWAGWFALKITVETWLRSGLQTGSTLVGALATGELRFDGHKGMPLSFRSGNRELRQPLYLVTDGSPRDVPPPDDEPGGTCGEVKR